MARRNAAADARGADEPGGVGPAPHRPTTIPFANTASENVGLWLNQVTLVSATMTPRERIAYAISCLRNDGILRWSALHPDPDAYIGWDWGRFTEAMRACFIAPEARDQLLLRFNTIQLRGTDIAAYEREFCAALQVGAAVEPVDAVALYIAGLSSNPRLADIVRQGHPDNLGAAMRIVQDNRGLLQAPGNVSATSVAAVAAAASPGGAHVEGGVVSEVGLVESLVAALRLGGFGRYQGGGGRGVRGGRGRTSSRMSFSPAAVTRTIRCYKCGGMGHVQRDCPSPIAPGSKIPRSYVSDCFGLGGDMIVMGTLKETNREGTLRGQWEGVRILIDSGAEKNLVSAVFSRRLQLIPTDPLDFIYADGNKFRSGLSTTPLHLRIGDYSTTLTFRTCALHNIDLVLGREWLTANNPNINWATGAISLSTPSSDRPVFLRRGTSRHRMDNYKDTNLQDHASTQLAEVTPVVTSTGDSPVPVFSVVSAKSAQRCLRRPHDYVAWIDLASITSPTPSVSAVSTINASPRPFVPSSSPAINKILEQHADLFQPHTSLPPLRDEELQHKICLTPDAQPPARPPYRLSWSEKEELHRQLQDLLKKGLITPSSSPFASPVLLVRKPDATFRLCVDYRLLNKSTIRDRFPIPNARDLFDRLQGASVFTKMDLASGFWQLRLHPDSEAATAFSTPDGHFQWRVMPMGLCNAPSTFQRTMQKVLGHLMQGADQCVLVYLDDLLVFSKNLNDHCRHLQSVLAALRLHSLRLKASKCTFATPSVSFLGHNIQPNALSVEEAKVNTLRQWPTPKTRVQLQAFLGFCNFYRHFIASFAHIAAPLTDLLKGAGAPSPSSPLQFTDAHLSAFKILKDKLCSAPVLTLPTPHRPFVLHVDASDTAVGAVLEQDGHPVAFASKKLSTAETNYPIREKELYAQVFGCEHFRVYLQGGPPFMILTDHASLETFDTQLLRTGRLARWVERLALYNYKVVYRAGKNNIADALSRLPIPSEEDAASARVQAVDTAKGLSKPKDGEPSLDGPGDKLKTQELVEQYSDDPYFARIVRGLTDPHFLSSESLTWRRRLQRFTVIDGSLFLQEPGQPNLRRCVPRKTREALMVEFHSTPIAGHPGATKMYATLRQHHFWPRMAASIARHVSTCDACCRNKATHRQPQPQTQPLPIPTQPWEFISLDFMDLPPTTQGHDCLLTVVDCLSNYIHAIPTTRTVSASDTVDLLLQHVIKLHGIPKGLVSDRDARFTSDVWQQLWTKLGSKLLMTTAHRPQGDGRSERANRTIQERLRAFTNSLASDWDSPAILSMLELGINYSINPVTGVSPFTVTQGFLPLIPATLSHPTPTVPHFQAYSPDQRLADMREHWQRATVRIEDAQQRQRNADPVPDTAQPTFPIGSMVMLSTRNYPALRPSKLHAPFVGPFRVTARPSPAVATLELPTHMHIHPSINIEQLKAYTPDVMNRRESPGPVGHTKTGEALWDIDRVIGQRTHRGQPQFKIRWKGFDASKDTWEPAAEIRRCAPDLIAEFRATVPTRGPPRKGKLGG